MYEQKNGRFHLLTAVAILCVFLVSMAMKDWLNPHFIIVDELPSVSDYSVNNKWKLEEDPWIRNLVVRSHMGLTIARFSRHEPIARWFQEGYLRDDGVLVPSSREVSYHMPQVNSDKRFALSLLPLIKSLGRSDSQASIHVSDIGTLSMTLSKGRRFILGRSRWLQQWNKARLVLRKYPKHENMQYDMRYSDGIAMKQIDPKADRYYTEKIG